VEAVGEEALHDAALRNDRQAAAPPRLRRQARGELRPATGGDCGTATQGGVAGPTGTQYLCPTHYILSTCRAVFHRRIW